MISLKNISKSYGSQAVLKDFSLVIPEGSRIAIMGRSGAGKTTILRLIMGLVRPDSGEVAVPKNMKIGAVFQEDRLIEPLTAEANCRLVMKYPADDKISELLSRLGITPDLSQKPVNELSGGERRRVALARAILSGPDVLILDEPFKGIDQETMPSVISEADRAADGRTLILVTHSPDEAAALGCEVLNI